jgi:hypothetical protein
MDAINGWMSLMDGINGWHLMDSINSLSAMDGHDRPLKY